MKENTCNIAIFGLGYIGLPTASLLAQNGFKVTGVDINPQNVEYINQGRSPITEPGLNHLVEKVVDEGYLKATTDGVAAARQSNVMVVVVPTPVDSNNNADLTAVVSACDTISRGLGKGDLVIIESTVPPFTCERIVIPILERSGLKAGDDFKVAYTPERALPNNTLYEMTHNARVIGGINQESSGEAAHIYQKITQGEIIQVENLVTAEMVKLMENTYRDTNIALANELALICEKLDIDVFEAIKAANFHPRVNIHTPGPGVGGHCLSIDPYFLVEIAERHGTPARLIKTSRDVNELMPHHVAELVAESLNDAGKKVNGSTVCLLGVAYKGNVADSRETPAGPLISDLISQGADVAANDPHVDPVTIIALGARPVELEEALNCDCVVLMTDHDQYREITPDMIKSSVFICTRPILRPEDFQGKGYLFKSLGRP